MPSGPRPLKIASVNDEQAPEAPGGGDSPAVGSTPKPPSPASTEISRRGRILINVLIGLTTLLLVLGMFSVFANRLLLNPDNWSATSTKLLQDPNIRSTTATFLVDRLYAKVNVAGLLRAGLPPRLDPLAGPAAGALRNAAVQAVDKGLQTEPVQNLWAAANRRTAQLFVTIVEGGKGPVAVNQGVVTLDLGMVLQNMASRVGLPASVTSKLAGAGTVTILKSHQLKFVENVGNGIKGLALWLTIFVPLLYALAIGLARGRRRRTLMTVGISVILAGILVFLGRRILVTQIPSSLTNDESLRATITATVDIITQILSTIAGAVVFTGILLVAAAWVAGPARYARAAREKLAPYLREYPLPTYATVLGLLVLVFIWQPIPATGTPAGIIVFTVLGLLGTYLLREQTAAEFPGAQLPKEPTTPTGEPLEV